LPDHFAPGRSLQSHLSHLVRRELDHQLGNIHVKRTAQLQTESGIVLVVTVRDKLIRQILAGRSDSNIQFEPLCHMLRSLGFHERIRGDHHIFGKPGIVEIINLQPLPSGKAKAYQVKQVRNLIVRYKLVAENDRS
jgi:hypothetical protein